MSCSAHTRECKAQRPHTTIEFALRGKDLALKSLGIYHGWLLVHCSGLHWTRKENTV